ETDVPREARPVGVALLDADAAVLEGHEDLGVGVGIERRLESHFELPRVEVLPLHPLRVATGPHVPGRTDLRIELRLVALPPAEPRGLRRVAPEPGRV